MGYQRRVHGGDWSLLPQSLRASQRPHESAQKLEREREEGEQIKRISSPESNLGEISESGINPENLPLNLISSFGSRSEQISASRKPLFLDTTLCLKEPSQETMIAQGQESCLHTPVWGVEGFNISTSKEVEGELTTGKQHTRVFNGLNNHNVEENSNDTAMINTINFDDLLFTGFLFALYWPIEKISSSIVSKLVQTDEVGTAFSLLAVMSKCIGFVARPVFAILYKATVDVFPGAFAVASVGGLAVIFVIMLFLHIGISRRTEIDLTSSPPEAKE